MRILYLIPGTGCSEMEQKRREAWLNAVAAPGTCIDVRAIPHGPAAIESLEDEYRAIPPILNELKIHAARYDAFIVGCAGDAGVDVARTILSKPVVGPGESSLLLGTLGNKRFAIVTTNTARAASKSQLVQQVGLDPRRLVASLGVHIPVLRIQQEPEQCTSILIEACRQAKDRGAEVMLLGCMSLAFLKPELLRQVEYEGGLKLVNPVVTAVKLAEALIPCTI